MFLPGTANERIGDLRTSKKLSQKELSEIIGIAPSQMSRIENGETQRISSDILIKLAKVFGVSTDYILGLTTVSVPKSYDISELGLSEGAVRALVTGAVDVQMLNRLLEHKTFPYLLHMIKTYFDDKSTAGIKARNEIIDIATATLGDFIKENPEHKAEAQEDMRLLKSYKLGEHEADTEKIKSTFLAILKDIKKDMDDEKTPGAAATADFLQTMREELQSARQSPKSVTAEDVAAIVANMVGQVMPMDGESAELFKQLAVQLFEKNGTPNDGNEGKI